MFIRISKNNILRTPEKTLLFALLIAMLTLLLFLCVFTYSQTGQMQTDYEKDYITIAEVECPSATGNDGAEFDYTPIASNSCVTDWQPNVHLAGLAENFTQTADGVPCENEVVAVIGNIFYDDHIEAWTATVRSVLYSYKDIEGKMLFLYSGDTDFKPESKKFYVIHGSFRGSRGMLNTITLCGFDYDSALSDITPYMEISDVDAFMAEGKGVFFEAADYYNRARSCVDICPVRSLESNLLFHQKIVYITSGRGFTDEEYSSGAQVCVVSEKLAASLGLGVGDKLPLMLYGGGEVPIRLDEGLGYTDYEIVGIINTEFDILHYIYVPEKTVSDTPAVQPVNPGTLYGQAIIRNGSTEEFLAELGDSLPENVILTVYDHGYASVVKVLASLRLLSLILSLVCAAVCTVILLLYGYMFVIRQRETVQTMLFLGTPKKQIFTYLLFGSGAISLISSFAGTLVGMLCGAQVFTFVYKLFASVSSADSRFSNTSVGVINEVPIRAHISPMLVLSVFLAVFLISVFFCSCFASGTFEKKNKRGLRRTAHIPKPPKHSSTLPPSPLRYSLLSIARGGRRSFIVPVLALVMVVFLCTVAFIADSGDAQIREIYDNTKIRGHITDLSGKQTQGLMISPLNIETISESGYITDTSSTVSDVFMFLGVYEYADGTPGAPIDFQMPHSSFAIESFQNRMESGPSIVFTDNLAMSPELINSTPVITWADSFNPEKFLNPSWEGDMPCLITDTFSAANKIGIGDTVQIILTSTLNDLRLFNIVNVRVVGTYINPQGLDTMYAPLAQLMSREERSSYWMSEIDNILLSHDSTLEHIRVILYGRNYTSCYFTLADTRKIDSFKDFLESEGFSRVGSTGRIRMSVQLEDKQFYESMRSARQQTQYMKVLFPLLFIVAGAAGVAVSSLMTGSRREEIAIMRGCGASKKRTFLSFFFESAILCTAGGLIAWGGCFAVGGAVGMRFWICLPLFVICYLAGGAISLGSLARARVSEILRTKE